MLVARGAVSRAETRAKDTVVQNITSRCGEYTDSTGIAMTMVFQEGI